MQMMQTDPKGAMLKFQDDEDVTLFLKEFGAAMAAHFEKLGEAQAAQQQQQQRQAGQSSNGAPASGPIIQEVGPLQAKALQRQKEQQAAAASTTTATVSSAKSASKAAAKQESEEERVQRVSEYCWDASTFCCFLLKFQQQAMGNSTFNLFMIFFTRIGILPYSHSR